MNEATEAKAPLISFTYIEEVLPPILLLLIVLIILVYVYQQVAEVNAHWEVYSNFSG